MKTNAYTVILAGGGGTRLWPQSKSSKPKQFLKLYGDKTMIQVTAERARLLSDWSHIIVVTNHAHVNQVRAELPELPPENIIGESEKKDTAMAMLTGAIYARSLHPDAIIINCAADHIVLDFTEYKKVMQSAVEVAKQDDVLVTVGISPTYPEVGFGYIKIGDLLNNYHVGTPVFKVDSFTEKPNLATAKAFMATGKYFWNANMYVWSAQSLIKAFEKYQPDTYSLIKPLLKLDCCGILKKIPSVYKNAPAISIDYAISEKADNLVLIPGDFKWSDVGDWKVVHELNKKDANHNVCLSHDNSLKTLTINSSDNMIYSNGRLVALYGVHDMIVIDTNDAVLVIPKSESQNVKKIVEQLKKEKKDNYL